MITLRDEVPIRRKGKEVCGRCLAELNPDVDLEAKHRLCDRCWQKVEDEIVVDAFRKWTRLKRLPR